MSRATCPTCHQHWPEGKDPADAVRGVYAMRIIDFIGGLQGGNSTMAVCWFNDPVTEDLRFNQVCQRATDIAAARAILEGIIDAGDAERIPLALAGLAQLAAARAALGTCPAFLSLPAFLENGNDVHCEGLETFKAHSTPYFRAWLKDGAIRFEDKVEGVEHGY